MRVQEGRQAWHVSAAMLVQGQYIAPRVTNLALQYITTGVSLSASWKTMKPHMQSLLANVVFPLCCFDDEDQELWDEDPQEYIRKVGSGLFNSRGPLTDDWLIPVSMQSFCLPPETTSQQRSCMHLGHLYRN